MSPALTGPVNGVDQIKMETSLNKKSEPFCSYPGKFEVSELNDNIIGTFSFSSPTSKSISTSIQRSPQIQTADLIFLLLTFST